MRFSSTFQALENPSIDDATGIIKGVSVLTRGEAKGHDFQIDDKTLEQVKMTAIAYAGGVKVKMNHDTGVESIVGILKNFRTEGDRLRGDLHLLKSDSGYAKTLEMARTMPESFGLSLSMPKTTEDVGGIQYLRCNEIHSADLVDAPAANPSGLLSSKPNTKSMLDQKFLAVSLGLPETATEKEIADAFTARLKPQTVDLAAITKAVKDAMPAPTVDLAAIQTEIANLKALQSKTAADAELSQRKAMLEQAGREGKVISLSDDRVYGNAEKKIAAVDLEVLREMIAGAPKIVSLARNPALRVVTSATGTTPAEPVHLEAADRAKVALEARQRAVAELNISMRKQIEASVN